MLPLLASQSLMKLFSPIHLLLSSSLRMTVHVFPLYSPPPPYFFFNCSHSHLLKSGSRQRLFLAHVSVNVAVQNFFRVLCIQKTRHTKINNWINNHTEATLKRKGRGCSVGTKSTARRREFCSCWQWVVATVNTNILYTSKQKRGCSVFHHKP